MKTITLNLISTAGIYDCRDNVPEMLHGGTHTLPEASMVLKAHAETPFR